MFLTMLIIGKDILLVNTKKVRGKFWRVRGKNGGGKRGKNEVVNVVRKSKNGAEKIKSHAQ